MFLPLSITDVCRTGGIFDLGRAMKAVSERGVGCNDSATILSPPTVDNTEYFHEGHKSCITNCSLHLTFPYISLCLPLISSFMVNVVSRQLGFS